jgi:hypothetical protein
MKRLYSLLLFILLTGVVFSQQQKNFSDLFNKNGEIYFTVNNISKADLNIITEIVSVDNVTNTSVYANANETEFREFLKSGFDFTLQPHPNENFNPEMASFEEIKESGSWDYYPTYDAYVAMMYQFATDYPEICEVSSIGQTVNGRELLVAKISDNVNTNEDEPEFLYTSTMHGDETAGYIFMLRLIDTLLTSYGTNARITKLVDSIEIYINPLANPDGTYHGGNSTVGGAIRRNGNNIDLNRNYPDPENGPHPDGNAWQPETVAFMNFAENHHFVMSCNMHAGAEVCNYPWDTWYKYPADTAWWEHVCREYADTAHIYSPSGYMSGFDNGVVLGWKWYSINGGRQDYMNYFQQCREFTLELSNTKLLPESQLPVYWEYNRRSLLNYMEQVLYGVRGIVTDVTTGQPVVAEVEILNHDIDSSMVFSDLPAGNYHRPVYEGTYDIRFSAPGYEPDTVFGVQVANESTTVLNIALKPIGVDLDLKVFLEGPFDNQMMNANLNAGNLLPVLQPFNTAPWNYSGIESVSSIPNENVVDWILVELIDTTGSKAGKGNVLSQQAAFLLKNGRIAGLDGSDVPFRTAIQNVPDNLFVILRHRNHLDIMSATALTESNGIYQYDFTTGAGQAFGTGAQKEIAGGIYGMYSGDINGDGTVDNNNKSVNWQTEAGLSGYLSSDLNFDGEANNIDKDEFWIENQGKNCQIPELP